MNEQKIMSRLEKEGVKEYYNIFLQEDETYSLQTDLGFNDEDMWHIGDVIQNGYDEIFAGIAMAKEEYVDNLCNEGFDWLTITSDGELVYTVGPYLVEVSPEQVAEAAEGSSPYMWDEDEDEEEEEGFF